MKYVRELETRYVRRQLPINDVAHGRKLRGSSDVRSLVSAICADATEESFGVVHLTAKNAVQSYSIVSRGTLTGSLVHPREVFKGAVMANACAIIIFHNHPSGVASPSHEDNEVTRRLVQAGELMGIRILDHVIVGDGESYSYADNGAL